VTSRLAFLAAALFAATGFAQVPAAKIGLEVLYAGVPDAPRTAEWKEFLSKTFSGVGAVDLETMTVSDAKDFDVVIVDSPSPIGSDRSFKLPKPAGITLELTKPTILVGAAGGAVLNELQIKLQWL
jgi:hypothetical protein